MVKFRKNKTKINLKELVYLEGSGVDGTGTELVIVQEQVLKVSDQGQSISGDAVDDILLQMKKHKTARQTLWDCTQVVI